MAVLAHFAHQHARPATVLLDKCINIATDPLPVIVVLERRAINTRHGLCLRIEASELTFHGERNFPDGGPPACGLDGEREQVPLARHGALVYVLQYGLYRRFVALFT